jgi:hypothetical protein
MSNKDSLVVHKDLLIAVANELAQCPYNRVMKLLGALMDSPTLEEVLEDTKPKIFIP